MALEFRRTIGGVARKLERVQLTDAQAVAVGDAIETYTTGYGILPTLAKPIFGIIASFVDENGMPKRVDNPTAGTASGVDVRSIASTSSDYAMVDFSNQTVYSTPLDADVGTTGDTLGDLIGAGYDLLAATPGTIDESSYTRTLGTPTQVYSWGLDPEDSTRVMVTIALSELDSVYE